MDASTSAVASMTLDNNMASARNAGPPPQPCQLLKLPAELRNKIYELALDGEPEVVISASCKSSGPPLLFACKHIRQEAHKISLSTNAFHASWNGPPPPNLRFGPLERQLTRCHMYASSASASTPTTTSVAASCRHRSSGQLLEDL